jgi:hypothetical protein
MTLLPALPEKPQPPPMPLEEVLVHLRDSLDGDDWEAADALLQTLDCRNVEAVVRDWPIFDDRALRPKHAIEDHEDLPAYMDEFLMAWEAGSLPGDYPLGKLWQGYFRNLMETAERVGSTFLKEWLTWEISLRNELAEERAERLDWSVDEHLLEPPHGQPTHQDVLVRMREASDPLDRQRKLDGARLAAIEAFSGIDPFSVDAVLSYVAAVLILDGWRLPESPEPEKLLEEMRGGDQTSQQE